MIDTVHLDLAGIVTRVSGAHAQAFFSGGLSRSLAISQPKKRPPPTSTQTIWQNFFRTLDLLWQGLNLETKQAWNKIGVRRKKIGYWVYMKYNLTNRKPPLSPVTHPSSVTDDEPPI